MDDLDIDDPRNAPALLAAIRNGDYGAIRRMLDEGADPDTADTYGWTALQEAGGWSHWDIAALLLERGANPNAGSTSGVSAAECAAASGDIDMFKRLRNAGANIKGTLPAAATEGRRHMVRFLLDEGAPIDERDSFDETALMCAASSGHLDVVELLLERGADKGLTDEGKTALDLAQDAGHVDVVQLIQDGRRKPRRSMQWFTPEWNASGDLEWCASVERDYRSSIQEIGSRLPEDFRVLSEAGGRLSLHDARFVECQYTAASRDLVVGIEVQDQLDVWLGAKETSGARLRLVVHYEDAEIVTPVRELVHAVHAKPSDIIQSEFGAVDPGLLEHRFQLADLPSVVIRFRDAHVSGIRISNTIEPLDFSEYLNP